MSKPWLLSFASGIVMVLTPPMANYSFNCAPIIKQPKFIYIPNNNMIFQINDPDYTVKVRLRRKVAVR